MGQTVFTRAAVTGGSVRLAGHGELDCDTRDEIIAAVQEELAAGRNVITMDLRDVTFLDAGAVRALESCRNLAVAAGGDVRMVNAIGVVARVLDLTIGPGGRGAGTGRQRDQSTEFELSAELTATSAYLIARARGLVAENQRIISTINR